MQHQSAFRFLIYGFCFLFCFSCTVNPVLAQTLIKAEPANISSTLTTPCIGYLPQQNHWGYIGGLSQGASASCPAGWALLAVRRTIGGERAGRYIDIQGACCPLPLGVLTEKSTYVTEVCPENYVATGVATDFSQSKAVTDPEKIEHMIQCREVDTTRFSVDQSNPGTEVGTEAPFFRKLYFAIQGRVQRRIAWNQIPAGFRYAVGRNAQARWPHLSCIGFPLGAVMVGKLGKQCLDIHFSQIIDRGTKQPIQSYARCRAVRNPTSPDAECIPE